MKSIIRNYLAKLAAGRTDDGIMITLPDPKKINFQEAMIQDLLMRNGVDPNAITSEEMLKSILNQIDMASKQTAPSGIRGTRSAQVLDMEGQTIPQGSQIMGGKAVDTDVDTIVNNIKSMEPITAMKEANSVIARKGKYKNLTPEQSKKILQDTEDHIFERDVKPSEFDPDIEDMADGGRIGLKGGLTPSDYLKVKDMLEHYHKYKKSGKSKISKADFAKEFFRENNADGGRIGYFMGSQLPKGLATLRQMLQYMGKKSDRVTNPSDVLKMVNPKSLNAVLEDPRLQGKVNVKEGILASDMVKGFQSKMGEDRVQLVKDMLSAAKNIKGADTSQSRLKNEIIEDMMKKGIDRQMAEEMATTMSRLAEDMAGKFKDTPKLTDEGILELENILKNMETGGKPKRSLNADGGRIGLKDGMNRRTFLKLLGGLASIPIVGKIFKPLKTVKGVKNVPIIKTDNVPGKPEWFDQLVNKVIIEGDDVTKKLATKDREVVHVKKLNDTDEVTVYQDLETDSIRVEYNSPQNMLEEPVDLMYTKNLPDEGAPKGSTDFEVTESGFVSRADGPDDYFIDAEPVGGSSIKDLDSDVSKLKEYATGQKPTMKEFIQNKKRKDKVKKLNEGDLEAQSDYIVNRQGDYVDYDEYASGGIAGMLGE
jgi:hypothetical protein